MESGPTQAVLPLVGLAAEKVIRDRYNTVRSVARIGARSYLARVLGRNMRARCAPCSRERPTGAVHPHAVCLLGWRPCRLGTFRLARFRGPARFGGFDSRRNIPFGIRVGAEGDDGT
ncbi:MAG: hypothetical protein ACQESR_18110 [Planctomycetota bacterium]